MSSEKEVWNAIDKGCGNHLLVNIFSQGTQRTQR